MLPMERLQELDRQLKKLKFTPLQQLLYIILLLFATFTLVSYVAYLMGNRYFVLPSSPVNVVLDYTVCCGLFVINVFFITCFCCDFKLKFVVASTLLYPFIYAFHNRFFNGSLISTVVFPLIWILLLNLYAKKPLKQLFKSLMLFAIMSGITVVYSSISGLIKLNLIVGFQHYNDYTVLTKALYSIDLFVLFSLLIVLRKEKRYHGKRLEFLVLTKEIGASELDSEDQVAIERFNTLSGWSRAKAIIKLFAFQVFQLFLVLAVCAIGNTLLECCIILIVFWFSRKVLKKCWHSSSVAICTLSSVGIFYAASRISIPARYSLLFPLLVGLGIAYSLYRVGVYAEYVNTLKRPNKRLLDGLLETEFRDICRYAEFSKLDEERAVDIFVLKTPHKEVAEKYFLQPDTVRLMKRKFRKRLEPFLDKV